MVPQIVGEKMTFEDEDTQVIDCEIKEDDRVEWRKQNGQPCRGIVAEEAKGGLLVLVDSPTGEPCPVVWGPVGIFSKVD